MPSDVDIGPECRVESDPEDEEIARATKVAHTLDLRDGDVHLLVDLLHVVTEMKHVAVPPGTGGVPEAGGDGGREDDAQCDRDDKPQAIPLFPGSAHVHGSKRRSKRHQIAVSVSYIRREWSVEDERFRSEERAAGLL